MLSVRLSVIRFLCSAQNIREFAGRLAAWSIGSEIKRILETLHIMAAQLVLSTTTGGARRSQQATKQLLNLKF